MHRHPPVAQLSSHHVQYVLVCSKEHLRIDLFENKNQACCFYFLLNVWIFLTQSCVTERLDQDMSGILTTICNHSFHCSCISKWADSSCPVSNYGCAFTYLWGCVYVSAQAYLLYVLLGHVQKLWYKINWTIFSPSSLAYHCHMLVSSRLSIVRLKYLTKLWNSLIQHSSLSVVNDKCWYFHLYLIPLRSKFFPLHIIFLLCHEFLNLIRNSWRDPVL